jgi:hypothetical protein
MHNNSIIDDDPQHSMSLLRLMRTPAGHTRTRRQVRKFCML